LSSRASDIRLSGTNDWTILASIINIEAEQVVNNDPSGISGTLRLQVWATATPYAGSGSIAGHVLGTTPLDPLEAGYYYYDVSENVLYTPPPYGNYYTTLTVEEWTGSDFVVRDWVTSAGTSLLGDPGEPGPGVELSGKPRFRISKNSGIRLRVPEIHNAGVSGASGALRVELWANQYYYVGGNLNGYLLASNQLESLDAGIGYYKLNLKSPRNVPPPGTYCMVLVLWEDTAEGWVIRDFHTFTKLKTFR
jgi:hypothetical protein